MSQQRRTPRPARPGHLARRLGALAVLLFAAAVPGPRAGADDPAPVTLFAAASTATALDEIAALYESRGLGTVRPVFAASSTLAKQIARGAPADLFLSANLAWMDYLDDRALLEPRERRTLLGNRLVLIAPIAPRESLLELRVAPDFDLAGALGKDRLAMGDPDHVPAGLYGKAALKTLGVWAAVAGHAAFTANVRAALALVERRAAGAGIVYASDARISSRVRVIGQFPADSHPPVEYPLATVRGRGRPAVAALREFLQAPEARAIFERNGFRVVAPRR